jgi:hypothetical protein
MTIHPLTIWFARWYAICVDIETTAKSSWVQLVGSTYAANPTQHKTKTMAEIEGITLAKPN